MLGMKKEHIFKKNKYNLLALYFYKPIDFFFDKYTCILINKISYTLQCVTLYKL